MLHALLMYGQRFLGEFWAVALDTAPWLLAGLAVAGLLKAVVPTRWLARWLGGRGVGPVVKAALVGTPLPLCSCGVVPAALGLRRQGASPGATIAFLVATPENGIDSLAVTYALLGGFFTIIRPIAAIGSAILAGMLAELVGSESRMRVPKPEAAAGQLQVVTVEGRPSPQPSPFRGSEGRGREQPADCCCAGACQAPLAPAKPSVTRRLRDGAAALVEIYDDIRLWLLAGIGFAALLNTFVTPHALAQWGSGLPAMLAMLALGVPMYSCATASTPVAAALLLAGVSPGTVLVFLLASPATNAGTLGIIRREFGWALLGMYLLGITIGSLAAGLATDALVRALGIVIHPIEGGGEFVPGWLALAALLVLVGLALRPGRWKWGRSSRAPAPQEPAAVP